METSEKELMTGFRRSQMTSIKGQRTRHRVTMNPNSANPNEEL